LAKYLEQKDALHAGGKIRPDPDALKVKDVASTFLNAKSEALKTGKLSPRTWADYRAIMDMLKALGISGRKGLGFNTLRHAFRTVADEAMDQPAADYVMGHEVAHRSSVHRETISDERLKAVTDHVRKWLFGVHSEGKPPASLVVSADQVQQV
jgi:hypothetical protein